MLPTTGFWTSHIRGALSCHSCHRCLPIQSSPPHAPGNCVDCTCSRVSPLPLCRERMTHHVPLSAPCFCSGFLPAHPDVFGERRRLASLHQRRVCQRKAPGAARVGAAGDGRDPPAQPCSRPGQGIPPRAEVSQPSGSCAVTAGPAARRWPPRSRSAEPCLCRQRSSVCRPQPAASRARV